MKPAIHTSAFSAYDRAGALREISRLGYRYVELAADLSETPHFAAHAAGDEDIRALRAQLDLYGLELAAIDIGGWDPPLCIAQLDEDHRTRAVAHLGNAIDAAGALGCGLLTAHLWGLPTAPETEPALRAALQQSIDALCPRLETHGIHLNFMPHPGGFIEESDPTIDLIRTTGCPHLGYTYGISHTFGIAQPDQDAAGIIDYAGDLLTHVLISDTHAPWRIIAPPAVKAHQHLVPGQGDIDFGPILAALARRGYGGYLCAHLISERDRIHQAASATRERLERWLAAC